jgi:hypothetical protein
MAYEKTGLLIRGQCLLDVHSLQALHALAAHVPSRGAAFAYATALRRRSSIILPTSVQPAVEMRLKTS